MGRPDPPALTVGVEEEFLLIDPETGQVLPVCEDVRSRLGGPEAEQVVSELAQFQIETNSGVHTDLRRLEEELLRLRRTVGEAAAGCGARLAACGTALFGHTDLPPLTHSARYRNMRRHYRDILRGQGVCGCHVHVGIEDREEAVQVSNHVRPWLPVLQALTSNSPISYGHDTGYASWRAIVWGRWPSTDPPPFFHSAEHYDALVAGLGDAGVILDEGMVYWQVRLSRTWPTMEFRLSDSCATAGEAVLLAGLIRALSATALADVRAGVAPPEVDQTLLSAACWGAARGGLEGENLDLLSGARVPVWESVGRLLDRVRPALAVTGDLPLVVSGLDRLRRHGSGAVRQRHALRRRVSLLDVADLLIRQTQAATGAPCRAPAPIPVPAAEPAGGEAG
ncbi:putative glutamate--cysteine ligase 2 [Microtetraspora sp. NBRC 13810]|uniref:carboxylate-amine ligase n=1 Tax=Microtetraspora sp. NBRC 13810 TaxID=3030990 RepID=UPI0024A1D39F|nr:glutamate--cysteine ligase [Microtetraspora sp. NBRC 13810]GLW05400.1 putative glutamate--cysteine ligase 2 [Microtetraspora sp. NBRC 13810]